LAPHTAKKHGPLIVQVLHTEFPLYCSVPVSSKDGKQLFVIGHHERAEIIAIQLTFSPMSADVPHWSPGGQRIAFAAFAPGKASKLWLISREAKTPEQLTESDVNSTLSTGSFSN
jgi:Tol biopolymer transport system component